MSMDLNLTLCMIGDFLGFFVVCRYFSTLFFPKESFSNSIIVSKNLDPDQVQHSVRERSGSVVECLTPDREAVGLSLTGVTALWSLSKTHLS